MAYSGGVGIAPPQAPRPAAGIAGGFGRGTNWYKAATTGAAKPNQPGGVPTATPQQPGNSPTSNPPVQDPNAGLDATYAANTATNQFNTNNKINALTTQGAQNEVALQSALAQLSGQQPYDQLKEEYNANRGGGLYSTVYGQNQGRIGQSYFDREQGLQQSDAASQYSIAQQVKALQGGIPLFNDQQAAASYLRAAAALAKDPAAIVPNAPAGSGTGINTGAQSAAGGTSVTRTALANAIAQARQKGAGFGQKAGPRVPTGGVSYKPVKGPSPFTKKTAPTRWRF